MSTISISYDLAKDHDAQAFRIAVAAEGLFSALIEFYQLTVERRDVDAKAEPAHKVRALFRERLTRRTATWALKANALKPEVWRRPARVATLTVEVGFPYLALMNADGIFATVRAVDASFQQGHSPLPWKEMVATILAKLDENGAAPAFQNEIESRGFE